MNISCLTITQLNRIKLLERSIYSYSIQTMDLKFCELIIVHHDGTEGNTAIYNLLTKYKVDAKVFSVPKYPLGKLRNLSIEFATGDLLCQWDDDDFYHPERLNVQSTPFFNSSVVATTLSSQLYLFYENRDLFIRDGAKEGIHGTIMFRNGLGLRYENNFIKGEDSALIKEILKINNDGIFCINNRPEIFVRTYHGKNTWKFTHHYDRLKKQAYSYSWLLENEMIIRQWLKELEISDVNVRDTFQIAFHA